MTPLPNPLIPGFYPDPSVVKVGSDYYLATSTFEYLPGIPVFHSTDLVGWELIGHVVERPGQLASADVPTNGGAWAPTIRHRAGTFYVVVTDAMGRGMLIFTATDPAGPWSDGTVVEGIHGIDPDLAWDDGVAYVTYSGLDTTSGKPFRGHGGILQITVDLETGGATVGLMYGSNQTYVGLKARNVKYPKKMTSPSAVNAGATHHASTRRVIATSRRGCVMCLISIVVVF